MKKVLAVLLALVIFVIIGLVEFGIVAGFYFVICWAFGLTFTWKIAFGVWVIIIFIHTIVQNSIKKQIN